MKVARNRQMYCPKENMKNNTHHIHTLLENKRAAKKGGFTLIELSIILVILSFIAINMVITDTDVKAMGKGKVTRERMTIVHEALLKYAKSNHELPCPAISFLLTTHTDFGESTGSAGDCDPGLSGGISGIISSDTGTVYTGMIPIRTLGLPEEYAFDGWDRRIKYVVAQNVTLDSTYMNSTDIKVLDDYTNSSSHNASWYTGNHEYTRFDNVPYLLLSYGEDGQGAFERVPSGQSETSMVLYTASETNYAEAMNNKMVNLTGSGDESEGNGIYVLPKDVMDDFDDILSVGYRYPASIDYPDFDPRGFNEGNTQRADTLNVYAWYNADLPSTLSTSASCSGGVPNGGDGVECWRDITGNPDGVNLIKQSNSNAPSFEEAVIDTDSGGNTGNVVRFDSSNSQAFQAANFNIGFPMTAFVIVKSNNWNNRHILNRDEGTDSEFFLRTENYSYGRFAARADSSGTISSDDFTTLEASQKTHVISIVFTDNSNSAIYLNGKKSVSTTSVATNFSTSGILVGAQAVSFSNPDNYFDGDIMEMVFFEGRIGTKKRQAVERMLAAKWTDESESDDNIDMVAPK